LIVGSTVGCRRRQEHSLRAVSPTRSSGDTARLLIGRAHTLAQMNSGGQLEDRIAPFGRMIFGVAFTPSE
jgi:hypothetical protein